MANYAEVTDPIVQAKVKARYAPEIAQLLRQGFHLLAYSLEALGPYSAIFQLPVLLLALGKKEVVAFPRPLRLAVANVLLARDAPSAIALCMGMGVKIYTGFTDGTLLISSTFHSDARPKPTSRIIRPVHSPNVELAWSSHEEEVSALEARGKVVQPGTSFRAYASFSVQEEDLSQYAYG